MTVKTHSDRGLEAALKAMGIKDPRTAALVLFMAASRHVTEAFKGTSQRSQVAMMAYQVGDELVDAEKGR